MSELVITLPRPVRYLTPNCVTGDCPAGVWKMHLAHIGAKKKAKKDALDEARRVLEELGLTGYRAVEYELVWFYYGNRTDADNCLASCKAYLDGCAEAFGGNDRDWDCAGVRRLKDAQRAGTVQLVFRDEPKDNDLKLW